MDANSKISEIAHVVGIVQLYSMLMHGPTSVELSLFDFNSEMQISLFLFRFVIAKRFTVMNRMINIFNDDLNINITCNL